MAAKKYQLVFQFAEEYFATRADVVAMEARIRAWMPRTCDVDGFDVGSGTTNFFVYTAFPAAAYKLFRSRIATRQMEKKLRIAYRLATGKTFTNLWPRRDPRPFAYTYAADANPFARGAKRGIPKRSPRGTRAV